MKKTFRPLNPDEVRVVVVRHGNTDPDRDELPKDTVSQDSYRRSFLAGVDLFKDGVRFKNVASSPRGRALKTAFALAEGNTPVGESLPPFQTDDRLGDISSVMPEVIPAIKKYGKKNNLTSEEEAVIRYVLSLPEDDSFRVFFCQRVVGYASVIMEAAQPGNRGKTILIVTHGGVIEPALLLAAHGHNEVERSEKYFDLNAYEPKRLLKKEEGVELILDIKTGKIVELNYLENC